MNLNGKIIKKIFLITAVGLSVGMTFSGYLGNRSFAAEPIKIGASLALTGKYSWTGERYKEGLKVWETLVNERGYSSGLKKWGHTEPGLIDGRPVKVIIYDDKSDPATGVKLYHKLITDDKVDLCFGPYSSAVTKAISTVVERAKIPTVTAGASDPGIWKGMNLKWVVQSIQPVAEYFPGVAEIGAKHGAKTAAIVYEDTAFPISLAKAFRSQCEALGIKVVLFEPYPKGITDWTPILAKAVALKPDIIGIGGYEPDSIGLTKAAEALKAKAGLFVWTVGGGAPSFVEAVGDACHAVTCESLWEGILDTPGNKDYVKATYEIIGTPPDKHEYHTTFGFLAGQIMEIAVKKAGTIDRKAVRDMLHKMEVETVYGPYKVEPLESKDSGFQIASKGLLIQWQPKKPGVKYPYGQVIVGDWVKEVIWPEKLKTADPIYPHPGWN